MTTKQCLGKKPMAGASAKVQAARRQDTRFKKSRYRGGKKVTR